MHRIDHKQLPRRGWTDKGEVNYYVIHEMCGTKPHVGIMGDDTFWFCPKCNHRILTKIQSEQNAEEKKKAAPPDDLPN